MAISGSARAEPISEFGASAGELHPHELSDLIGLIYDGPGESPPWSSFLEAIRVRLDAGYAFFLLRPPSLEEKGMQVFASGGKEITIKPEYHTYGYALDPFVNLPNGAAVTADEMVGAERWVNCEFFRQFMPPDMRFFLGADVRAENGIECRLRIVRPPESADFSTADKALCELLLPHLKRSVRFHRQVDFIDAERRLYATTVDRLLVGTVILDDAGLVLKTNAAADHLLEEKDGIKIARGALRAEYPEEDTAVRRLIDIALGKVPSESPSVMEAVSIRRPSGRHKLGVLVRRVEASEWSEERRRPAAVVYIRDPERHSRASYEVVRQLFDLTPAEASVAMLLANGLSLEEVADELVIRKNTARAHLRAIFSKTGVSRQTTLVRVLINNVMALE